MGFVAGTARDKLEDRGLISSEAYLFALATNSPKIPFRLLPDAPLASPAKEPSLISSAVRSIAPQATRASAPPILMRRTPRPANSATERSGPDIRTLSGLGAT